jgi:hypothetical protein
MNIRIKDKVKHWFNFYQLSLNSKDPQVIQNLKKSSDFYKSWGDITSVKYDDWWKTHSYLFHTPQKIEVLSGDVSVEEDCLYLKIPFTLSPTTVSEYVKRLYDESQSKRVERKSKSKRQYVGQIKFKPEEFPNDNFNHYFTFTKKVFIPLYEKLGRYPTPKDMIPLSKSVFSQQKVKTEIKSSGSKIKKNSPFRQMGFESEEALSKSTRRYRQISINLLLNVSLGIFPGDNYKRVSENFIPKVKKEKPSLVEQKIKQKRVVRNASYTKKKKIVDQDNPTGRKTYVNVVSRKVYKGNY